MRRRYIRLFIALIVVLVVISLVGVTLLGGSVRRLTALEAATGRVRWSITLPDNPHSAPGAGGGRVFVVSVIQRRSSSDKIGRISVLAFDTRNGDKVWEYALDPDRFLEISEQTLTATPRVLGDTVFVNIFATVQGDKVNNQHLLALDANTGQEKWLTGGIFWARGIAYPEIQPAGNALVALKGLSNNARLVLLDPATGSEIRTLYTLAPETESLQDFVGLHLQTDAKRLFLPVRNAILTFDAQTGAKGDSLVFPFAAINVSASQLYARAVDEIIAVDPVTLAERWRSDLRKSPSPFKDASLYGLAADQDSAFVTCDCELTQDSEARGKGAYLIAFSAQDGHILWNHYIAPELSIAVFGTPVAVGDLVVTPGSNAGSNEIIALAKSDGTVRWRFKRFGEFGPQGLLASDGDTIFATDRGTRLQFLTRP